MWRLLHSCLSAIANKKHCLQNRPGAVPFDRTSSTRQVSMHSRTSHRTDKSRRRRFNAMAPQHLARSRLEEGPPTADYIWEDGTVQAAVIAIAVIILFLLPLRVAAQPSATPAEILERVAQTQKVKVELEAQIRELRGQLDAEIYKLKSWSALNAVGRTVAWPMTATRVEMGFFAHDIVAETAIAGVEVRCQLPATEENKQLKVQYPRGTQFTCVGRIGNIMSLAHPMAIILNDAKVTGAGRTLATTSNKLPIEPVLNTQKVPIEHARKAVELFQMACLPLFTTHAADIVEVKATVHDGWSPACTELGAGVLRFGLRSCSTIARKHFLMPAPAVIIFGTFLAAVRKQDFRRKSAFPKRPAACRHAMTNRTRSYRCLDWLQSCHRPHRLAPAIVPVSAALRVGNSI